MNVWLRKNNRYSEYGTDIYKSQYDFEDYYDNGDIDAILSKTQNTRLLSKNDKKYIQEYDNNKRVHIDHKTNLYECNKIFRNMMDNVITNNMCITLPNKDNEQMYIFDTKMKESFYEFIKKHSL